MKATAKWPARKEAFALLTQHLKKDSLIKHCLAVEQVMRDYAASMGEDAELWGLVGLLHDMDYELTPEPQTHGLTTVSLLSQAGYPEAITSPIREHNAALGFSPSSKLSRMLCAVDELTGLMVAAALVRPDKKLAGVKLKSVKKRFKEKAFARQVNREEIANYAEQLGIPLEQHLGFVLESMQKIAPDLDL